MNPEPSGTDHRSLLLVDVLPHAGGKRNGSVHTMAKRPQVLTLPDRIRTLAAELRPHDSEWADRLSAVSSEQELIDIIAALFNRTHALDVPRRRAGPDAALSIRIATFVQANLHRGLTLKLLAGFLGYSEKYCSDLFQAAMGESFSDHLKRRRLETAQLLLSTTDKGVADIATATGFSDQFAFSHFFKRATGQSPMHFRSHHRRRSRTPSHLSPKGSS